MGCGASTASKAKYGLGEKTIKKTEDLFDKMKGEKAVADAARLEAAQKHVEQVQAEMADFKAKKRSSSAVLTGEEGTKETDLKSKLADAEEKLKVAQEAGLTKDDARAFFKGRTEKGNFAKLSAEAMFNEVDVDKNGNITRDEFVAFWGQVKKSGYKEEEILEEIENMLGAGEDGDTMAPTWVDWKDDRDVVNTGGGRKNSKS